MPIAITRTVRKIVFRWAFRELRGLEIDSTDPESNSGTPDLTRPNPVESYLLQELGTEPEVMCNRLETVNNSKLLSPIENTPFSDQESVWRPNC